MKITLQPSYATANTVRFDEVAGESEGVDALGRKTSDAKGAMGTPLNQYFTLEQLNALGWKADEVGDSYETEPDRRGKTYTRWNVKGANIQIDFKVV